MRLHHQARLRWGKRCPCCDRVMTKKRPCAGQPMPTDMETRGHDVAVARGGDINIWVTICWRCNNDQGELPFFVWARKLRLSGDPREKRVEALALFIGQEALRSSTVPLRLGVPAFGEGGAK